MSAEYNLEASREGARVIDQWLKAKAQVKACQDQLSHAHLAVSDAEHDLVAWLMPGDAKPGEKIAVWYGDSLIQVEVGGIETGAEAAPDGCRAVTHNVITIRARGKRALL